MERNPFAPGIYMTAARAAAAMGRDEDALELLDRELYLNSLAVQPCILKARIRLAAGQLSKAKREAEEALRLYPASPEAAAIIDEVDRKRRERRDDTDDI